MGIVLTILGIIGKILLILLGILIILILLLLFVPFRYSVSGTKNGKDISGAAGITWLLHAVSLGVRFEKESGGSFKKETELKVFGISPGTARKNRAEKKKQKQKEKKKKKLDEIREEDPARYEELRQEALRRKKERDAEKRRDEEEEKARREKEQKEEQEAADRKKRRSLKKRHRKRRIVRFFHGVMTGLRKMLEGFCRLFTLLYELPAEISWRIWKFVQKLNGICDTIHTWGTFLLDPRTFEALKLTGTSLKKLWKKIRPRHLKGEVTYGLDDPSVTGKILAFCSALFPVYGPDFILHPDFEEKRLEGNAELSGRIFLGPVVFLIGRYLLNPNTRYAIQFLKGRKKKEDQAA